MQAVLSRVGSRTCSPTQSEVTEARNKMTWARVVCGSVHLHTLYGGEATSRAQAGAGAGAGQPAADGAGKPGGGPQAAAAAAAAGAGAVKEGEAAGAGALGRGPTSAPHADQAPAPCGPLAPLLPRLATSLCAQWPSAACQLWDVAAAVLSMGWVKVPPPAVPAPAADAGQDEGDDEVGESFAASCDCV